MQFFVHFNLQLQNTNCVPIVRVLVNNNNKIRKILFCSCDYLWTELWTLRRRGRAAFIFIFRRTPIHSHDLNSKINVGISRESQNSKINVGILRKKVGIPRKKIGILLKKTEFRY